MELRQVLKLKKLTVSHNVADKIMIRALNLIVTSEKRSFEMIAIFHAEYVKFPTFKNPTPIFAGKISKSKVKFSVLNLEQVFCPWMQINWLLRNLSRNALNWHT